MQIICPECQFAREVDESKIPARSKVATCPKCQTKFQFRELPEDDFLIEEPEPTRPAPVAAPPSPKKEPEPPTQEPKTAGEENPEPQTPPRPAQASLPVEGEDEQESLWQRLDRMRPPEQSDTVDGESPDEETAPSGSDRQMGGYSQDEPEPPQANDIFPDEEPWKREAPQARETRPMQEQDPVPGWTGEFNEDFPDPMQFQDEESDDDDLHSMQVPPPFEQLDRYGFFHGLFMTLKLVLMSPRMFFSVMPVGNGVSKPLTFAILVALIQAVAQFAWGSAGLSITVEPTAHGFQPAVFDTSSAVLNLLLTPAGVALMTYALSGLYWLLLVVARGNSKGFEGTFRALAYAYAPAILGLIPLFNVPMFMAVNVVSGIWSLVITAIGLKYIHKTSYGKVIPVMIIPFLLAAILAVLMVQSQLVTV